MQSEPRPFKWPVSMLWRVSRPLRSRSKPDGFILPCQPALADRPPSGPGWLHEIKFDGYRVIARKDGAQVRLWARTEEIVAKLRQVDVLLSQGVRGGTLTCR